MSNAITCLIETPALLERVLADVLPGQRWFGDKTRAIERVSLERSISIDHQDVSGALLIAGFHFQDGTSASYAVPIAIVEGNRPSEGVFAALPDRADAWLVDGLCVAGVRSWLLQRIAVYSAQTGLTADAVSETAARLRDLSEGPSRLLKVEQSNSAVVFGEDILVKLFRRLQPGINPDVELTRFLTTRTSFVHLPSYAGSLSIEQRPGESTVLAVAQQFVDSTSDGWSWVLDSLQSAIGNADRQALSDHAETTGRQLGRITAEMHLALAQDPWTPTLAPEPIMDMDANGWSSDFLIMLGRITQGVRDHRRTMSPMTVELADAFLAIAPGLESRAGGFARLLGRAKTRVHGDYHLGQTLRTRGGDFVVLDFEGEPQRSIEERRRKTSPLKDVAGMLRSFSYARGTATPLLSPDSVVLNADLVNWERGIRDAFLAAYGTTVADGGGSFLPDSAEDTSTALSAWELDKAAYEVLYELNNRPDWLWIPLAAMIKYGSPDSN